MSEMAKPGPPDEIYDLSMRNSCSLLETASKLAIVAMRPS
jgi:hypothetical protein